MNVCKIQIGQDFAYIKHMLDIQIESIAFVSWQNHYQNNPKKISCGKFKANLNCLKIRNPKRKLFSVCLTKFFKKWTKRKRFLP